MRRFNRYAVAAARSIAATGGLALFLAGCASSSSTPPAPPAESLGRQMQAQDAELIGKKFRTLLDFERPTDAVFVRRTIDGTAAGHTGRVALAAQQTATVNVSSLLFGTSLPGDWTLIGAYLSGTGGQVTTTLLADGRPVGQSVRQTPSGAYLFNAIDLTTPACQQTLPRAAKIELRFDAVNGFLIDDVLLVNNRRVLAEWPGVWTVENNGLSLVIKTAGGAPVAIPSLAAAADGWAVAEVSPLRLRLTDATGRRQWTWLPDGTSVIDGRLQNADTPQRLSFGSPGEINADAATGRVDRESAGDANNDGFNEVRAAYQVVTTAARVRLTLTPAANPIVSPLLEIRGLPAEANVVTVEGKLIDRTARLPDGTLLVWLPMRIQEPTEITVGVAN